MSKLIAVIYTSRPIAKEHRDSVTDYVDKQLRCGKTILLDDCFTIKFYKAEDGVPIVVQKNPHVY